MAGARWRWGNVPLPQAHLAGLGAGLLLGAVTGWGPEWPPWVRHGLGWPLVAAGAGLAAWAVLAAGAVDVARPDELVRSGPYRFGRNPMYVAWTLVYVGASLVLGAAWPLLLLPAVLARIHVEVLSEERALGERFGDAYGAYRRSVRRYL